MVETLKKQDERALFTCVIDKSEQAETRTEIKAIELDLCAFFIKEQKPHYINFNLLHIYVRGTKIWI